MADSGAVPPADQDLKHRPFAALATVAVAPSPRGVVSRPVQPTAQRSPVGRVVVREELDDVEKAIVTRVIGLPRDRLDELGRRFREALGLVVQLEGRDLLVLAGEVERVAELVRSEGASEVAVVKREAQAAPAGRGEAGRGDAGGGVAGGTVRAQLRRGMRVAIVQKADQESGALTEGVIGELLTSSPTHPRGIKVRLASGEVGRVRRILS